MIPDRTDRPREPKPITLSKLLLVEGRDGCNFFEALLCNLHLESLVEIRDYGGVNELRPYLFTLPAITGYKQVVSLGVVRDAEHNGASKADDAFRSVRDALRDAGLPAPEKPVQKVPGNPTVAVFILPDCEHPGMLETLCLDSVSATFPLSCVDAYLQCLQEKGLPLPRNMDKARLHAYLAGMPELLPQLGLAARAGYFPWDSPVFDSVTEFLKAL